MVERQLTIPNRLGLHARPAAKLVHLASGFDSDVFLRIGDDEVDAKSILGVLQLGAAQGTELEVVCDGDDEETALDAMSELIDSGFGEMDKG